MKLNHSNCTPRDSNIFIGQRTWPPTALPSNPDLRGPSAAVSSTLDAPPRCVSRDRTDPTILNHDYPLAYPLQESTPRLHFLCSTGSCVSDGCGVCPRGPPDVQQPGIPRNSQCDVPGPSPAVLRAMEVRASHDLVHASLCGSRCGACFLAMSFKSSSFYPGGCGGEFGKRRTYTNVFLGPFTAVLCPPTAFPE